MVLILLRNNEDSAQKHVKGYEVRVLRCKRLIMALNFMNFVTKKTTKPHSSKV
jgi:hypothetical protein